MKSLWERHHHHALSKALEEEVVLIAIANFNDRSLFIFDLPGFKT